MRRLVGVGFLIAAVVQPLAPQQTTGVPAAPAGEKLDRTVLPILEPPRPVYTEFDARNAEAPPRFEVKAPPGAPNVVIILIDDLGFGATSTFGGPVTTPTLDRLAQGGLRYTNFNNTSLCSPTRAALKSCRNHHTVNMGFITEMATGFPGATGQIPDSTAPVAEIVRLNGYSTAAFGSRAFRLGPTSRTPTTIPRTPAPAARHSSPTARTRCCSRGGMAAPGRAWRSPPSSSSPGR